MELHHSFTVPAPATQIWDLFMDLPAVARCFPGATVTSVEGGVFQGSCKVKLGPIALLYAGSGTFVERDDARHVAVIEAKGKDKRGNGTASATVTLTLRADGESATLVDVTTDLSVTGKPAQFGRGVMQDVSDRLLQQFVDCLEQRFVAPAPPSELASSEMASSEAASPATTASPAAASRATPPSPSPPPSAPAPPSSAAWSETDDALDVGSAVALVVLKSYAPYLLAGLAGAVVGVWLGRRLRRG